METRTQRRVGKRWMFGAIAVLAVAVTFSSVAYNRMRADVAPPVIACAAVNQSGKAVEYRFEEKDTPLTAAAGQAGVATGDSACRYGARDAAAPIALQWRAAGAADWRTATLNAVRPDGATLLLVRFTEDGRAQARYADADEAPDGRAELDAGVWNRGDWAKG